MADGNGVSGPTDPQSGNTAAPAPAGRGAGSDAAADAGPAPFALHICARCRHQQMRVEPELFSAADLQTPAILKAQVEVDQQKRQRAQQEAQRVAAGLTFDYEPHSFAWCAAYTPIQLAKDASAGDQVALTKLMAEGAGVINPVTGEVGPIYALCVQKNPDGQCPLYEAK